MNNKSIWDADLYPASFPSENIKTGVLIIGAGISGYPAPRALDSAESVALLNKRRLPRHDPARDRKNHLPARISITI